ncbi:hypothetical protein PR003_g16197 [Phytophthora rubi]|uniref:Uncharacterized protein n=1 Tax=Phytophthora rubi TaxID=129364 RepID=A0A6A3KUC2_9STRA|nr:hypothetical protein PR001_g16168 [Phytophthora rubi]KAE9017506.1 hypothetical protein PR002_g13368 [Phytophthora rubi]KAE9326663.1 hypothetical protein PR003_g16197 [Phytophthora rubi]
MLARFTRSFTPFSLFLICCPVRPQSPNRAIKQSTALRGLMFGSCSTSSSKKAR